MGSILGNILQDWKAFRIEKRRPLRTVRSSSIKPCVDSGVLVRPANLRESREPVRRVYVPVRGERMASRLVAQVCEKHDVPREKVMKSCNKRKVVDARNELAYLLHEQEWGYSRIGRYLHKHHTTVMHGVQQHKKLLTKEVIQ